MHPSDILDTNSVFWFSSISHSNLPEVSQNLRLEFDSTSYMSWNKNETNLHHRNPNRRKTKNWRFTPSFLKKQESRFSMGSTDASPPFYLSASTNSWLEYHNIIVRRKTWPEHLNIQLKNFKGGFKKK